MDCVLLLSQRTVKIENGIVCSGTESLLYKANRAPDWTDVAMNGNFDTHILGQDQMNEWFDVVVFDMIHTELLDRCFWAWW